MIRSVEFERVHKADVASRRRREKEEEENSNKRKNNDITIFVIG